MGAGTRTQDPRFRKPMLYPAELHPHRYVQVGERNRTGKNIYLKEPSLQFKKHTGRINPKLYPYLALLAALIVGSFNLGNAFAAFGVLGV